MMDVFVAFLALLGASSVSGIIFLIETPLRHSFSPAAQTTVTVYTEFGQGGTSETFNGNCPSLSSCGSGTMDNSIYSVCVFAGTWVFYSEPNYNPAGLSGAMWGAGGGEHCFDIELIEGTISSMKYIGNPNNMHADSLSFWEHGWMQGQEVYTETDWPAFDAPWTDAVDSIAVTGPSGWTTYT